MGGANSTEFDPETPYPVIDLLPEQKEVEDLGVHIGCKIIWNPEMHRLGAHGIVGKASVGPGLEGHFAVDVLEVVGEAVRPQSKAHSLKPASRPINYAGCRCRRADWL